MIRHLHIENYKALRDVHLDLTQIHVLIGPNDSGKSSILDAISALSSIVGLTARGEISDIWVQKAFPAPWSGAELVWDHDPKITVKFDVDLGEAGSKRASNYSVSVSFASIDTVRIHREVYTSGSGARTQLRGALLDAGDDSKAYMTRAELPDGVVSELGKAYLGRWQARELARPVALPLDAVVDLKERGFGLALLLDLILGRDRRAFQALEDRFLAFFPEAEALEIGLEPGYVEVPGVPAGPGALPDVTYQRSPGKSVFVKFRGIRDPVQARHLSDGMLLALGYLALLHQATPPKILMIEEPENGVHPRRLESIIEILKEIAAGPQGTQVILTTHSPYVLSHFEPEQVTLCYRLQDGSVGTRRLSESKLVDEYKDVFTLGEIWTGEGDIALADDDKARRLSEDRADP